MPSRTYLKQLNSYVFFHTVFLLHKVYNLLVYLPMLGVQPGSAAIATRTHLVSTCRGGECCFLCQLSEHHSSPKSSSAAMTWGALWAAHNLRAARALRRSQLPLGRASRAAAQPDGGGPVFRSSNSQTGVTAIK